VRHESYKVSALLRGVGITKDILFRQRIKQERKLLQQFYKEEAEAAMLEAANSGKKASRFNFKPRLINTALKNNAISLV